jgi:hypothetical protein
VTPAGHRRPGSRPDIASHRTQSGLHDPASSRIKATKLAIEVRQAAALAAAQAAEAAAREVAPKADQVRSAIRASRASLTASRAVRRSTAAGLSAADLAWVARSSCAFFASAAALSRSAKLVIFDLIISTYTLMVKTAPGSVRLVQIGARRPIVQGHGRNRD